mgnify:CR=1 FL=1
MIEETFRWPQIPFRERGRVVEGRGDPSGDTPPKAEVFGPSGNPRIVGKYGHENRDQRITKLAELLAWTETIQTPADGATIAIERGNGVFVNGGSYTLAAPPARPAWQDPSTRSRMWMFVVVDQASSAAFSNVDWGKALEDTSGDPIELSGTSVYVLLYVEPLSKWLGFLSGTGYT